MGSQGQPDARFGPETFLSSRELTVQIQRPLKSCEILIAEDMSHVDVAAAPDRDRGFWLHLDLKGAPPTVDYLTSLLTWLRDAMPIMAEFDQ